MASTRQLTYDVYISYHDDTRRGFTGHLYNYLSKKDLRVFLDEGNIPRGSSIAKELVGAIENSRIFIIVFSPNYAKSQSCLDELVKILQEFSHGGRSVFPIFYKVDPLQLQHLTGMYKKAFAKLEKQFPKERVENWKTALCKAADIHGYHDKKSNTRYECDWISKIVEDVSSESDRLLHGELNSQVEKVISVLNFGSDDQFQLVGMCGIDERRIKEVVRRVYDLNADKFDGFCILNDGKVISQHGLVEQDIMIGEVNEGILNIKETLHQKHVLLVLHNVGKLEELQAIVGQMDWFGYGIRVIVTTQDRSLLTRHGVAISSLLTSHGFARIYDLNRLKEVWQTRNSTCFRWHQIRPHRGVIFNVISMVVSIIAVVIYFRGFSNELAVKSELGEQCLWNHLALPGNQHPIPPMNGASEMDFPIYHSSYMIGASEMDFPVCNSSYSDPENEIPVEQSIL